MPTSADQQSVSPAILCAGACALLALPVLLPVLLAISPLLLLVGLIWLVWRPTSIPSSRKAVDLSSNEQPTKMLEQVSLAIPIYKQYQQAQLMLCHHAIRICSGCQVDAAARLSVPDSTSVPNSVASSESTIARATPSAQPASSAIPVTAASSNERKTASLSALATANSKGNSNAASVVPAKTPTKHEGMQQPAAPATGSAALLARIRFALCLLLMLKQLAHRTTRWYIQIAARFSIDASAFVCGCRSQRKASSKGAAAGTSGANGNAPSQLQDVVVAYASQTGTAQEIARNIQAESSKHGIQSKVLSPAACQLG